MGLEPTTSCVPRMCSSQLSYSPVGGVSYGSAVTPRQWSTMAARIARDSSGGLTRRVEVEGVDVDEVDRRVVDVAATPSGSVHLRRAASLGLGHALEQDLDVAVQADRQVAAARSRPAA